MAKKNQSDVTKKYKRGYIICAVFSTLLAVIPLAYYIAIAFIEGEPHQKFVLGSTITVAAILVMLNIILKMRLRSGIWVLMLGIGYCIQNIQTMLLVLAITSILDELILEPIGKHCKQKYSINTEIDKRWVK